jgi:hypothetical protein
MIHPSDQMTAADEIRKTDCTYCKTPQPSLFFSGSPTPPFPADHQLTPTPPAVIAAAQARAEKSKDKNERWDRGLTLPGKLDLSAFEYKDEKTSIVFETPEMVSYLLTVDRSGLTDRKTLRCCSFDSTVHTAIALTWRMDGLISINIP